MKPHIVKDGFKKIGMIPSDSNINSQLEITLSCCTNYKSITGKDIDKIKKQFPKLVEIFD